MVGIESYNKIKERVRKAREYHEANYDRLFREYVQCFVDMAKKMYWERQEQRERMEQQQLRSPSGSLSEGQSTDR